MKTYLFAGISAVLIISTGIVNAYWTGVFGSINETEVLKEFAGRVEQVKEDLKDVGDWEGFDSEEEIDPRVAAVAGANASLERRYDNKLNGQSVSVMLVSGHFRQIAQHTPDQCYVAAGFQLLTPPYRYDVETEVGPIECYTTVFKKDGHQGSQYLRLFWTWSFDGQWLAPNMPRVTLMGHPALYKMYFITDISQPGQPIEQNPSLDFMRTFMPLAEKLLFPDRATASTGTSDSSVTPPPSGDAAGAGAN